MSDKPINSSSVDSEKLARDVQTKELEAKSAEVTNAITKAQKETLLLAREMKELERTPSWWDRWRSTLSVAGFASIVATTLPIATGIHGVIQKSRDIALEREKQLEAARILYLDRLEKSEERRASILRFIVATSPDDAMKKWALHEAEIVEKAQKEIEAKAEKLAQHDNKTAEELLAVQAKLTELESRMGRPLNVELKQPPKSDPKQEQPTMRPAVAVPKDTDAEAPTATTPAITAGRIPYTASSCGRFQPSASMAKGDCLVMCWDRGQQYNIRKTVTEPSGEECSAVALTACRQAGNSFCGFSWAAE